MENTVWEFLTDSEKGALLLAHHEGVDIEFSKFGKGDWQTWSNPMWFSSHAYRIKPQPTKVETEVEYFTYFPGDGLCFAGIEDASITITYTITDGIVTACDTIIHKNEE
jgi:hypothetical protein